MISSKGRYALRMLIDLAEHRDMGYIPLKDIAKRQDISKKYLEKIVCVLSQSGILLTNRGYQGGYMLAEPPSNYTVGQVLRVAEGSLIPVSCLDTEKNCCGRDSHCKTLPMWKELDKIITKYLDSVTLQDILDNNIDKSIINE